MSSFDDILRRRIEDLTCKYTGEYDSFKEARKNARKVAKIKDWYSYIEKVKTKNKKYVYVVKAFSDSTFHYYVHKDGRVCSVNELEKENQKWKRHPEKQFKASPFSYNVENRKKREPKEDYLKRMSIQNRCPY